MRGAVLLILAALLLSGCGPLPLGEARPAVAATYQPVTAKGYPPDGLLVDADWVAARLDDPSVRLVDLSPWWRYRQGHLPNAVHLWWQDTMELHNPIYGMLVGSPGREELLGALGIDETVTVVAYDDEGGIWASRLIWLLHYLGHDQARLLDGGTQAWLASGRALTTAATPAPPAATFTARERPERILAADEVERIVADGGALIDGRSAAERVETWRGRLHLGQAPGALARPWPENLIEPAGPFLPADQLRERYAPALTSQAPVGVYGLFGAAAAHDYVALRLLGVEDARLYDGSWAEWGAAGSERPVAPLE